MVGDWEEIYQQAMDEAVIAFHMEELDWEDRQAIIVNIKEINERSE